MNEPQPIIAVFASDKGPGDPERASLMTQTGTYFARRGARLVCLAEDGIVPVPLITAARSAGGSVQIIADTGIILPQALSGVAMEVISDKAERLGRINQLCSAIVALPGSLASTAALFNLWASARETGRSLPVVMLNRHKAFEVLRGYAADVLAPGLPGHDRAIQFADNVEDLWGRVSRLITEAR